jgi:hypothetical protein
LLSGFSRPGDIQAIGCENLHHNQRAAVLLAAKGGSVTSRLLFAELPPGANAGP